MSFVRSCLFYKKCIPVGKSVHNKLQTAILNAHFYQFSPSFVPYAHHSNVYNKSRLSTCIYTRSVSNTTSRNMSSTITAAYEDVVKAQKDEDILIIDVREQSEINETGKLPGSIHIPMGDVSTTLQNLSENAFKEKFGKEKPTMDSKIILSCRGGKRSGMVQEELQKQGFKNVQNYTGGWLDWESRSKK